MAEAHHLAAELLAHVARQGVEVGRIHIPIGRRPARKGRALPVVHGREPSAGIHPQPTQLTLQTLVVFGGDDEPRLARIGRQQRGIDPLAGDDDFVRELRPALAVGRHRDGPASHVDGHVHLGADVQDVLLEGKVVVVDDRQVGELMLPLDRAQVQDVRHEIAEGVDRDRAQNADRVAHLPGSCVTPDELGVDEVLGVRGGGLVALGSHDLGPDDVPAEVPRKRLLEPSRHLLRSLHVAQGEVGPHQMLHVGRIGRLKQHPLQRGNGVGVPVQPDLDPGQLLLELGVVPPPAGEIRE